MSIAARVDERGHQPKVFWVVLLLLTAWISWPVALVLLAYLIWSGKLENWFRPGLWDDMTGRFRCHSARWSPRSSGNNAFDDYRSDTLRRLEEEEKEFREFLQRLRAAKDKAEFDQFMADRRARTASPSPATADQHPSDQHPSA